MKYWKNLSNRRGSVTVFVAVLLIPICVLQCALVDCARGISFRYVGRERVSLALASMLASFDSRLHDDYGLFGMNRVRVGNVEETFKGYLTGGEFPVDSFEMKLKDPLSQPEILGGQITARMELRTPIRSGAWFLEQLGLIEHGEKQGRAALLIAKGNELLGLSDEKLARLKNLLEGVFPGDTNCVNGFTKAHWLYVERETALITLETPDLKDGKAIARLLSAHEEYRSLLLNYCSYHNQSIGLIRDLQDLSGQIQTLISDARNLCEDDPGVSSLIVDLRNQAYKISNTHNMIGLERNLQLLTEKNEGVEWNIQMLEDPETYGKNPENLSTFLANLKNALSLSGIRDDFTVEMLDRDSSTQAAQMPEANWTLPDSTGADFVIPEAIYNTLPSVVQGVPPAGIGDFFDVQDLGDLTSFFDVGSFLSGIGQAGTRLYEDVLLTDYVLDTFGNGVDGGGYFTGEIEYILGGHASYKENKEYVQQKLFFLRFVLNLTHVFSDGEKRGLAQELGNAIALAISRGIGGDLYAVLIMCTWAACESGVDVSDLYSGKEVPLIKTKSTWRTSIEGLFESEGTENDESLLDLSYVDYLTLLLMTEDRTVKLLRIADVIEVNMTEKTGLRYKLSGVYTCAEATVCYQPDYWTLEMLPGRRKSDYVLQIQSKQRYGEE
ncbi:MAG: hypothetical protein J6L76_02395 [Clostridia bacterium]|nr:hypothetical protein [Clostridia bacterium]